MSDLLKQMKAEPGDTLQDKSCDNCEMNAGTICMGSGKRKDNGDTTYGMPIEDTKMMFPHGCDDFGISLTAWIDQEKANGR